MFLCQNWKTATIAATSINEKLKLTYTKITPKSLVKSLQILHVSLINLKNKKNKREKEMVTWSSWKSHKGSSSQLEETANKNQVWSVQSVANTKLNWVQE